MSDSPETPRTSASQVAAAGIHRTKRQRRPTGAPPPLPRQIASSTTAWLVLAAVTIGAAYLASAIPLWRRVSDHAASWLLEKLAAVRTPWLTDVANGVNAAGLDWHPVIGVAVVVLVIVFRRWRHLLVFTLCLFFLEIVGSWFYASLSRPRPFGVPIIGAWAGYSAPSLVVAALTFVLVSGIYCLVVPGRPRSYGKAAVAALVALFCLSRMYLAVDHPDDVLFGVALGVAIPVAAFRFFTPNEIFAVSYRRRRAAHVDVTGRRGAAIRRAVHDQLGLTVLGVKPVGLESSAGSTPLRLTVEGDPDQYLFAKLYTRGHVRADRWYKLWRTILYGTLEDEHPFHSVRQLAQYEDYVLRVLRDAGVRTAAPYGIVEITPEREYLLVTEFFTGATEIGVAQVDDAIIDQGLELIRALWEAGLAHRDIKPANLLVWRGQLLLVDVSFAQVRPSPWRQAVDLGNMMLVLAVRSEADRVYQRALRYFTPDELAEAFAATRGVASPTQLRAFMRRDPRDLIDEFRKLAPPRRPVSLQRWGSRRLLVAAAMLCVLAIAFAVASAAFRPAANVASVPPVCGTGHSMILSAQAVPSAALLPCIAELPSGWTAGGADISNGRVLFWLNSDQAGQRAVTITLTSTCDISRSQRIPSNQPGAKRYERPVSIRPQFSLVQIYTMAGGCVLYHFNFVSGAAPTLAIPVDTAIAFEPRSTLVGFVRNAEDLPLCGRGAACADP